MDELQHAMASLPAPTSAEEPEPAAIRLVTGDALPAASAGDAPRASRPAPPTQSKALAAASRLFLEED